MSPKPGTYSLTASNAVYANKALNSAYLALGLTLLVMGLHTTTLADGLVDLVWGAGVLVAFAQIVCYVVKSIKAGIRDRRVLAISIHEGAFVSVPAEAYV